MTGKDVAIARLASEQHGLVTRTQLLGLGLGKSAINHRLKRQRLHPVHRGVYLVGHPVPPPWAKEMAAVLACGKGAAVSHEAAAVIWDIRAPAPGPVDVTVSRSCSSARPGIRVHRARSLVHADVRRRFGVPVTSVARTLIDLAHVLARVELQRAYRDAQVRHLLQPSEMRAALARSSGRLGISAIHELLNDPNITRSEAEERLLSILRAADIGPTATNGRVGPYEVDFAWRRERLIVEVDGFSYHSNRAAFERDRLRDAALQAAGYRVVRVTWRQIVDRPEAVIARLAQALVR